MDDALRYLDLVLEKQEKAAKEAINKSTIFTSSGKYKKKITKKQMDEYQEQHNASETCDYPKFYRHLCPAHNKQKENEERQ